MSAPFTRSARAAVSPGSASEQARVKVPSTPVEHSPPSASSSSPWSDPGPRGEWLGLEDFPSFILGHLATSLQREVTASYLEPVDLTGPQWRMLAALAVYSPIAFSDLVKQSMSDKALISRTMQSLAQRGLAQLDADPEHGKKVVCRITARGRALYRRVLPRAQQAQAEVLALLEPQERAALHAALVKLRDGLASRNRP